MVRTTSLATLVFAALLAGQEQPRPSAPFQQVFTLRGVTLDKAQQAKVEELRKEYAPQLQAIAKERNDIYTREQRQARRKALEEARKAGKQGRELRALAEKAFQLTDEQKKQHAKSQAEMDELVAKIQKELRALLTEQQRRQLGNRNPRQQRIRPTHANVQYGPHASHVMDVWLAESDKPTPVVVSIHGGGFRAGNKSVDPGLLQASLDAGYSVVAITYRLSDVAIAPAQFHDSARAIQFIRHNAKKWNLDPKRIASTGGSAGAGLSLWLGFHDDLANIKSDDPVLRESSRLSCMVVYNGQSSYDPRVIRKLFPGTDTYKHPALAQLYDVDLDKLDELPKEKYALMEEVSALTHIGKGDAPAMLIYASEYDTPIRTQGIGIHHPRFGKVLKEKMDALGIECQVLTGVRRGSDEWTKQSLAFITKHFNAKKE